MKNRLVYAVAVVVCLLGVSVLPALAQQAPPTPPNVLQIFREEVKPGKNAAHERHETGWPRAFARANSSTHYIAMTSMTGPNEAWYLTGYDSLAAWEKDNHANDNNPALSADLQELSTLDGDMLSGVRGVVTSFRKEMSYMGSTTPMGQMRYMYVTTVRVRPGHQDEYAEINKILREAHAKAGIAERWSVFQVNMGMPRGTYLIIQPLKSLAEVDDFARTHGDAFQAAIGEEGSKKLRELSSAAIFSTQTDIFAFSPKMSYPPKDWVDADPDFWAPKQ